MFKPIFEGNLHIFKTSDVDMTAGQLVVLADGDKIAVAGAGGDVYGIVAQDVADASINNFKLDSVTHVAAKGRDKVGVYFGGGLYNTNQYSGNITEGTKLYSGVGGLLVVTASGGVVAYADNDANSANSDTLRIKLVI